jgi:hypothetical protein
MKSIIIFILQKRGGCFVGKIINLSYFSYYPYEFFGKIKRLIIKNESAILNTTIRQLLGELVGPAESKAASL